MTMRVLFAISMLSCTFLVEAQGTSPSLDLLQRYMTGSFSSAAQAARDTSYLNIELEVRRIWPEEPDGIWLYVEQAAAKKKDKPYRQRIYHLTRQDDSTFISTVCNLDSMHLFTGAYRDIKRFNGLGPADAKPLAGCALTLHWRIDRFVGSTKANECRNAWGKATYATSQVDVGPRGMVSWDRGYDASGTQVWGAEYGGYEFLKQNKLHALGTGTGSQ